MKVKRITRAHAERLLWRKWDRRSFRCQRRDDHSHRCHTNRRDHDGLHSAFGHTFR